MTSKQSGEIRAEFLRSPDMTTLTVGEISPSIGNAVEAIPVRYTQDGTPLPKNTPCKLWNPISQEILCSTFVGDDNGVALFTLEIPKYQRESITVAAYPNSEGVTYKVCAAAYMLPYSKSLFWPPPDAILPRNKVLQASSYLAYGSGAINGYGPGPNEWQGAGGIDVQPLPTGVPFPDGSPNLIGGAEFLIPSGADIERNILGITAFPFGSGDVIGMVNKTYWWRVASARPARQIYITPALDGAIQPIGCEIVVTATFVDEYDKPVPDKPIAWSWQRGLLDPPVAMGNGLTDANGRARATIRVPGNIGIAGRIDTLVASSGSIQTVCKITFAPSAGAPPSQAQIINPAPGAILTTGQPQQIDGAFAYPDRTYAEEPQGWAKSLSWSTDPYSPDISISPVNVSLRSSGFPVVSATLTTKSGGSLPPSVALVGAVFNPAVPYGLDIIRVEGLRFEAATDTKLFMERPVDGAQVPLQREVLALVRFVDATGEPISDARVTFSYDNPVPADATLDGWQNFTAITQSDGRAMGPYKATQDVTADLHAKAIDPKTNTPYYATAKGVKFTAELDGPGDLTLHSESGIDLRTGVTYYLTARYNLGDGSPADGLVLIWGTSDAAVSLGGLTDIISNGVFRKGIAVDTRWGDHSNVTITVASPNPEANNKDVRVYPEDVGSVTVNFFTKPVLRGLAVDKTYAANPFDGQFHPEQQATTIRAALELGPTAPSDEGEQVTLSLPGFGAPVRLYGNDGNELQRLPNSPDGTRNYLATFDASSRCDFWIMSPVFSLFTLQAKYGDQPALTSQLLIADIDNAPPGDIDPPYIHGVKPDQSLVIDPSSYTFNVRMDMEGAVGYIDDRATIALWMNGRVVFTGTGKDIDMNNGGVQIGYAALNPGDLNSIVLVFNDVNVPYKQRTFTANPLLFNVEGNIPPEPTPGSLKALEGLPDRITAWNAAQGIQLTFTDPKAISQARSVFCFFEDSDSRARAPRNVVRLDVKANETSVVIPQMYLAGYTSGSSLRVYYSIGTAPSRQWSQVASATLTTDNTTSARAALDGLFVPAHMMQSKEH